MAQRFDLNDNWLFAEQFRDDMISGDCDELSMKMVRLPHTVKETPFDYFDESIYQTVSGYRRHLKVPAEWKGKSVRITFEGAAHDSEVYLNGKKIGAHHCGYTALTLDLTEHLRYGADNVLTVRLDSREELNVPPFGYVIDYMTYGGLYRDVYLEVSGEVYFEDLFLQARKPAEKPILATEVTLGGAKEGKKLKLRMFRVESEMERISLGEYVLTEGQNTVTAGPGEVKLWTVENPVCYRFLYQLLEQETGELYDEKEVSFGFRFPEFRTDGFYLNDVKMKLRGLNRHQSYPYVGYAMPDSMQEMDAKILKEELGLNAVRTSHYPQSHAFLRACDELGLLVFTEMPGWQHIGDDAWKDQAVQNTKDMVRQYRNHPSIILWGVRINESKDDDEFYKRTNEAAHALDPTRQTGGVRAHKKSSLLEDVYTYNDFLHDGETPGCDPKKNVTSDTTKAYLVSEYNGHMYPTKAFDTEEHRREHAIRHANVLDAVAAQEDIAGSFGWCMFDYNTHKDFGSGDRICYHGVMDMFRNPKQAAYIYACQQEETPVLELSSSMDIGEHPGCNRGDTWIYTNAESVKMYKNDVFIKEYFPQDSPYKNLKHGPILVDDFIGNTIADGENFKPAQAAMIKEMLNATALHGMSHLPKRIYLLGAKCMLFYRMNWGDAVKLYNKYIGDWGGTSTVYRFEAIRDGKVVKTMVKAPATKLHLEAKADHRELTEGRTYDVASVRIRMLDENDNLLHFFSEPVILKAEGPIELVGPSIISLKGGMGGTYVRTTGGAGAATLRIVNSQAEEVRIGFTVTNRPTNVL
jgi:beta-galactosidase